MDGRSTSADRFALAVGRLVRDAREAAGMTQSAVDREAEVADGTVAKVERGEMFDLPVHSMRRITDAVGADPALLVPPAVGEAAVAR